MNVPELTHSCICIQFKKLYNAAIDVVNDKKRPAGALKKGGVIARTANALETSTLDARSNLAAAKAQRKAEVRMAPIRSTSLPSEFKRKVMEAPETIIISTLIALPL